MLYITFYISYIIYYYTSLTNITGYFLLSSPRTFGRGGGVGVYVHDSIKYCVKAKSCEMNADCSIDYLLLELIEHKLALCCMSCPPRSIVENIASTIESFKRLVSNKYNLIVGGDFNVNLLDLDDDNAVEFLNAVNLLALHPAITLPTRVTNTTKSLIDNFLCDFSFLPANTNVIATDISDHYAIVLHIPNVAFANPVMKRNFNSKNRKFFTQKLINSDWSHLYAIKDVNKEVNYFNKKLKRMCNRPKALPFVPVKNTKH